MHIKAHPNERPQKAKSFLFLICTPPCPHCSPTIPFKDTSYSRSSSHYWGVWFRQQPDCVAPSTMALGDHATLKCCHQWYLYNVYKTLGNHCQETSKKRIQLSCWEQDASHTSFRKAQQCFVAAKDSVAKMVSEARRDCSSLSDLVTSLRLSHLFLWYSMCIQKAWWMELEHERIIVMLEYPLPPFLSELVMHLKSVHA